jgi:hypothetical protein
VLNQEATIRTLSEHSAWRRGANTLQTDPVMLGKALDAAIAAISQHLAATSVEDRPNPLARYWMNRSEFWMQKAIALGWREVRDAANGEAPSVLPAYDRELIAEMLGELFYDDGEKLHTRSRWTAAAIEEQARLLREADNAEAANIRTVDRSPAVEGDGLPTLPDLPKCWSGSPVTVTWAEDGETTTREVWSEPQVQKFAYDYGEQCFAAGFEQGRLASSAPQGEAAATVCLVGDRYAHGHMIEVQLQLAGEDAPTPKIGDRYYTTPPPASQSATPSDGPDFALIARMLARPEAYGRGAIAEQIALLEAADNVSAAKVRTVERKGGAQ